MHISDLIVIAEIVAVLGLVTFAVYKNKVGKYTKGLPWPLEPVLIWLHERVGQPWTARYFNTEAQTNPLTAIYCAVMKMAGGRIWILLVPRKDETYTEGVYHIVGSMTRFTDVAGFFTDAIKRVLQGELRGAQCTKPILAGARLTRVRRGKNIVTEVSIVTVCEWSGKGEPKVGTWFDVTNPPVEFIEHEHNFILPVAIAKFREIYGI